MKTRPMAVALLLALAPATLTVPAFAQSSSEDPVTAMARARFKEGVEFYDKGQYEQARAAFLQAYALKKHPAVLLNLAWSCLKSGHALDAEKYFRQFLAEGKEITDKQRADATDGLSQSRSKIGRLEIIAPPGTEVTIDGDRAGSAPLGEPVAVEPGAHTVMFKNGDAPSDTQSVSVLGGEKATVRYNRRAGTETPAASSAPEHAAPPPPSSTPSSEETTEPAPTPPREEEKPVTHEAKAPHEEASSGGPGIFAPPSNLVPVVVGGILTGAGAAVAIAMLVGKSAAANAQLSTANQVRAAGDQCDPAAQPPTTQNPTGAPNQALASACASYDSDIANQNTDATVGNIALGVGIAAFVGTVIYWAVADKTSSSEGSTGKKKPALVPLIGATPQGGSFSLAGQF
jgi:hypothetical protein